MIDCSFSKQLIPILIRLAVYWFKLRASNLIGKVLSCRERRYRIVAGIARKKKIGKVAIGRARYLLNIVF